MGLATGLVYDPPVVWCGKEKGLAGSDNNRIFNSDWIITLNGSDSSQKDNRTNHGRKLHRN